MEQYRPGQAIDDDNPLPVRDAGGMALAQNSIAPLGYQQITSGELATVQRLEPPPGAMRAYVQNNGGSSVRWRDDGADPTASIGMRIEAGGEHHFVGDLTLPAFRDEGANSVLDVSYYG